MIILTCPNCGACMDIEENRQIAFCQYCGTKMLNTGNTVEINRMPEINNLMLRALEFESKGDFKRAAEYCSRILDLEPTHEGARELEKKLPGYSPCANVTIVYHSVHDDKYKLRITLDGRNWEVLNKNEKMRMYLPRGKHRIHFSGRKSYNYDISIQDENTPVTVVYSEKKHENTITSFVGQY